VVSLNAETGGVMSTEQHNKQIVNGYLAIIDDPQFDQWSRYFADTIVFNGESLPPQSLAGILANFHLAFPDLAFDIIDQIAEGDKVVTYGHFKGTHSGSLNGIPATMKKISWFGVGIDRIQHNKVVEMWHEMDTWGMLEQVKSARVETSYKDDMD
jgi:predicted ester cyclase